MARLEEITKERRLRCLGHVISMENCRVPNLSSMNRKPGRHLKNWQDIIRKDLKDIGLSWDEASEMAHSRSSWRQRVAQSVRHELRSQVKQSIY